MTKIQVQEIQHQRHELLIAYARKKYRLLWNNQYVAQF